MVLLDLLFALTVATVLTALFAVVLREERTGPVFAGLFVILFLAAWAGGAWLAPTAPAARSMYWLPFLLVGIFVALLVASVLLTVRPHEPAVAVRETEKRTRAVIAFNIFFWLLVVVLGLVIILRYVL